MAPAQTTPDQTTPDQTTVDLAIVGAGGAGLSLVIALERSARRAGLTPPSIAVIDPVHRQAADRTWCWWAEPEPESAAGSAGTELLSLAEQTWSRMQLIDRAGRAREYPLGELRYVMLRSSDFYTEADAALARLGDRARRITATVEAVRDGPEYAVVRVVGGTSIQAAGGTSIRARWVFDSRPAAPKWPGSTQLLQHFRGWTVRFDQPVLDPEVPTLMDFRVPQPAPGVAFGYCLPLDRHRALVEYTEFSRTPLTSPEYDAALTGYLRTRWDVVPGSGVTIEAVEDGVIPMTDAPFARRIGERIFRLGTAGGATRPSTGYTFAAIQRQAQVVAGLLLAGRTPPIPPPPYPARHRWMDAVLLRALDRGYLAGPELFTGLFADHRTDRVVRFLDGRSGPLDELAIMRSTPMPPMIRATVEDAAARLCRRILSR